MRAWQNKLFLGPMPGHQSLQTFENELRSAEIHTVVCLNPPEEVARLSPEYHRWRSRVRAAGGFGQPERLGTIVSQPYPLILIDIPIDDYRAPSPAIAPLFWDQAHHVGKLITTGERVFIHCTAGGGRTGTFGVAVLMSLGYRYVDAARELWSVGSYPEARGQERFLLEYEKRSKKAYHSGDA
jgi:hypothetical protein